MWGFIGIMFVGLVLYGFFSEKKKNNKKHSLVEPSTVEITVAFPDPRITTEYRFYKFIEEKPSLILNEIYKKILAQGIYLKPEYERAIQTKLKSGKFKNPHSFIDFFGTDFDMIGVSFDRFFWNNNDSYEIQLSFIKDGKIADNQTYYFAVAKGKFPFVELKGMNFFSLTTDNLNSNTFDVIYKDINVFLVNNRLVFESQEYVSILELLLLTHNLELTNARYVVAKEIAAANRLPIEKGNLLKKLKISNDKTSFEPFLNCQIVSELEEKGILLRQYEKTINIRNGQII